MAWLWPWKGDASSTASFEKTLSTLATKIVTTQSDLDGTRSRWRRMKVVTTLYLSFAYVVYVIVAALVIGYSNMGAYEWTGVAGGPLIIYATRSILAAFYNLRINSLERRLKGFQEERAKTIQKLKDATKYDSTLELIQKYGGGEAKGAKGATKKDGEGDRGAAASKKGGQGASGHGNDIRLGGMRGTPGRTNLPPPPTANIPRGPGAALGPVTPMQQHQSSSAHTTPHTDPRGSPGQGSGMAVSEEFAPNAFGPAPAVSGLGLSGQYEGLGGPTHWYDRVLDLLLGEDETAAKNRLVLICKQCRLVNGQAPPGTKTLAEVGIWKCMACGTNNGDMDEGKKIVREVLEAREKEAGAAGSPTWAESEDASAVDSREDDSSDLVDVTKVDSDGGGGAVSAVRRRKPKVKGKT